MLKCIPLTWWCPLLVNISCCWIIQFSLWKNLIMAHVKCEVSTICTYTVETGGAVISHIHRRHWPKRPRTCAHLTRQLQSCIWSLWLGLASACAVCVFGRPSCWSMACHQLGCPTYCEGLCKPSLGYWSYVWVIFFPARSIFVSKLTLIQISLMCSVLCVLPFSILSVLKA